MVIEKILYELQSSTWRGHKPFADVFSHIGFVQCKIDTDVWLKDCRTHFEYVCVYKKILMIMSKNPRKCFDILINIHGHKLKSVSKPSYHLGEEFYWDRDGSLAWWAKTYINKMLENYDKMSGKKA